YGKLPLYFEANRGQTDAQVKFLSRGGRHVLFLTPTEAVLVLTTPPQAADEKSPTRGGKPGRLEEGTRTVLRMTFAGGNPMPRLAGLDELPGKANYFIGNDAAKWRTNVPTYARVHYQDLYPGIDLIYYGNPRQLEYDLVVRPGADPGRIVLGFQGADKLEVDADGDLVFHTAGAADTTFTGGGVFGDAFVTKVNPTGSGLVYSTYLGGIGDDQGLGIAVDGSGNAYVTGRTSSTDFPVTRGAFQTSYGGGTDDVFVTKLTSTGSALVYSTYLGGSGSDFGFGIAVDGSGRAYVTGQTNSPGIATALAFQTSFGGVIDAFVARLNTAGAALDYLTYLGGTNADEGFAITLDSLGNAYVTGQTESANFPTTTGAFDTSLRGALDAFVTKVCPTGSALGYS